MDPYNAGGLEALVVFAVVSAAVLFVAIAIAKVAHHHRDR
jgi:hypothetical protein